MAQPLAERMRPKTLDEYIGQKHLVGEGAVLRRMIEAGRISSFILWGPPGVGKTTLAQIVANRLEVPFYTLSAVTSGVKEVREVIEKARCIMILFPLSSSPFVAVTPMEPCTGWPVW
jgi:putative ATPase